MKKLFALMLSIAMVASMFSGIAFAQGTAAQIALARFDLYAASKGAEPVSPFPALADYTAAGVTGAIAGNLAAYNTEVAKQPRIPNLAALQTVVTTVNAAAIVEANAVLAQAIAVSKINLYAIQDNAAAMTTQDLFDATRSTTLAKAAYLGFYRAAVVAATGFANATAVTTMVTAVNLANDPTAAAAALAQINVMAAAANASTLTIAMLTTAGVTGTVAANLPRYKLAVEAKPSFTLATLQTDINAVNTAAAAEELVRYNTAIATLNFYAVSDNAGALTTQLLLDARVLAVDVVDARLPAYRTAIAALTSVTDTAGVATVTPGTTLIVLLQGINGTAPTATEIAAALALINVYAASNDASNLTLAVLRTAIHPWTCGIAANLAGYKTAVAAATSFADAYAVDAMIHAVDAAAVPVALAKLNVFAVTNDASTMTIDDLIAAQATGTVAELLPHYRTRIAGLDAVTLTTEVQTAVNWVNANVPTEAAAVKVINDYAVAKNAAAMTITELEATNVTGLVPGNLARYRTAVAAATGFATRAELQVVITAVNTAVAAEAAAEALLVAERTALARINLFAVTADAATLTTTMLTTARVTGVVAARLPAYQTAIAAATAGLPTLASIQAVINTVNNPPGDTVRPVITHNAPSIITDGSTFSLRVTVTDNVMLQQNGVWLDGVAQPIAADRTSFTFVKVVDLAVGENVFTVSAVDTSGNMAEAKINILRTAPPTPPAPIVIALGRPNPAIGLDVAPAVVNGRTMVPFRWFGERVLGIAPDHITWNAVTQSVTLTHGITSVVLTMNSVTAGVNGQAVLLDVAPFITEGRTLVPARFLAETFGFNITWDPATNNVTIVKK